MSKVTFLVPGHVQYKAICPAQLPEIAGYTGQSSLYCKCPGRGNITFVPV